VGVLCRQKMKESVKNDRRHDMDEEGDYLVTIR
jgi:hypothetical protein